MTTRNAPYTALIWLDAAGWHELPGDPQSCATACADLRNAGNDTAHVLARH